MHNYEQYLKDISDLTGIPTYQVRYLMKIFRLIVGHEIYEGIIENDDVYKSRLLGIGTMSVEYDPERDDYNVGIVLSHDMKHILDEILDTNESPLKSELDKSMISKIMEKFKEVIND